MAALLLAMAAAALAGFSRGYAAFGTAMIYVPLVALAYDARTAVVTLFLVDLPTAAPLLWRAAPRRHRPTMLWMTAGALAMSPCGVAVLLTVDGMHAQLLLGVALLGAIATLILKPDLRLRGSRAESLLAGAISGFVGGMCGVFGPPAMLYLVARGATPSQIRADAIMFLSIESMILGIVYLGYGALTAHDVGLSLTLLPAYALATWCGARLFSRSGETIYRRTMLGLLCVVAALLIGRAAFALWRW